MQRGALRPHIACLLCSCIIAAANASTVYNNATHVETNNTETDDAGCYDVGNSHTCDCVIERDACGSVGGIWTTGCECDNSGEEPPVSDAAFGCYDEVLHTCDCDRDEASCLAANGHKWISGCGCSGDALPPPSPFPPPSPLMGVATIAVKAECPASTYDGTFVADNVVADMAVAIDVADSLITLVVSDHCGRRRLAGRLQVGGSARRRLDEYALLTFSIDCETIAELEQIETRATVHFPDAAATSAVLGIIVVETPIISTSQPPLPPPSLRQASPPPAPPLPPPTSPPDSGAILRLNNFELTWKRLVGVAAAALLLGCICAAACWRQRFGQLRPAAGTITEVQLEAQVAQLITEHALVTAEKEALEKQLGSVSESLQRARIDVAQLTKFEEIGSGVFGTVSRGAYLGTPCAIKRLHRHRLNDTSLETFKNEVEMQLTLRHPNVIQVIGGAWDLQRGEVCMVMELAPHGTLGMLLADRLAEARWAHARLPMALGMARAMAYLHSMGIIHRDLKPDNVLLAEGMVPKVADFGVSRAIDATMTMTAVGTPLYSAPELLMHGRYDSSVDVWSFGCVIACLWAWQTAPYPKEEKSSTLLGRVIEGQLRPETRRSALGVAPEGEGTGALASMVDACCCMDCDERPGFNELCTQLEELMNGTRGSETPEGGNSNYSSTVTTGARGGSVTGARGGSVRSSRPSWAPHSA